MTKKIEQCSNELVDEWEEEEKIDKIIKLKIDKKFEQCSYELVDEWEEEAAICSSLAGDNKQAKHKCTWNKTGLRQKTNKPNTKVLGERQVG